MMQVFLAAAIAIEDPRERAALFLDYSLRRTARILCVSHSQIARLRSMAMLRLEAHLARHDDS